MGAAFPVPGADSPAIRIGADVPVSLDNHGLDRDGHSLPEPKAPSGFAEIKHGGIFMHFPPDTMARIVPDGGEALRFYMLFNGMPDITQPVSGDALICPTPTVKAESACHPSSSSVQSTEMISPSWRIRLSLGMP